MAMGFPSYTMMCLWFAAFLLLYISFSIAMWRFVAFEKVKDDFHMCVVK